MVVPARGPGCSVAPLAAAGLLMWATFALPIARSADSAVAERWLEASARIAAASHASGVYGEFALAQIALEQARVHALRGEVRATESRLPDLEASRPEWVSGGDGMVRTLIFTQDAAEVRRSLVVTLARTGRVDEAFAYVQERVDKAPGTRAWRWLGHALAGRIDPGDPRIEALEEPARIDFELGLLRAALAEGHDALASSLVERLPAGRGRFDAIVSLAGTLTLEGESGSASRLMELALAADPDSTKLPVYAASSALASQDLDAARKLASRIPDLNQRDETQAQVALSLLVADRGTEAAELFDTALKRESRRWEHVALLLDRYAWLESHYVSIQDPWRRTERFYQLARKALAAGDPALAYRLAGISYRSHGLIRSEETRWHVLSTLAQIFAGAGDIERGLAIAAQVPDAPPKAARYRGQAQAVLAAAWAGEGDRARADSLARSIRDPELRANAYGRAAVALHPTSQGTYQDFVNAARQACHQIPITDFQARDRAWASLIEQQLAVQDRAGADQTAAAATDAAAGAVAYESILKHALEAQDFAGAMTAARAIPAGTDPRIGRDRREHGKGQVIEAMASHGKAREALPLIAGIEQKYVRERAGAAVAESLTKEGAFAESLELITGMHRDDVRQGAIMILLRAMPRKPGLPNVKTVMSLVPERGGARLCWAVAAAAAPGKPTAEVQSWLDALPRPLCRAFAHAGAAYAISAPRESLDVDTLMDRVDPRLMMPRLERALREARPG